MSGELPKKNDVAHPKVLLPIPPELLWGLAAGNGVFIEDNAWKGMTEAEMLEDAVKRVGEHIKSLPNHEDDH